MTPPKRSSSSLASIVCLFHTSFSSCFPKARSRGERSESKETSPRTGASDEAETRGGSRVGSQPPGTVGSIGRVRTRPFEREERGKEPG
eukprot:scaffold625_cov324-Pavlova_lutheri.AAC.81